MALSVYFTTFYFRYTSMVNGYSAIAVTKLDILDELDEIKIGTTYIKDGKELNYFPSSIQVMK